MIIESAFFKMPEILHDLKLSDLNQRIKEAALVNYLSMAVVAEFNSRNIENPFKRIQNEKHYLNQKLSCDMFVSFKNIFDDDFKKKFTISDENYCEVKFFFGYEKDKKKKIEQTTTTNVGYVLNDLSRLQCYTKKEEGRYFLVFFDSSKWKYLAKNKKGKNKRQWLDDIFTPGYHKKIDFDILDETRAIKKEIKTKKEKFNFEIITREINCVDNNGFNGYLVKVLNATD